VCSKNFDLGTVMSQYLLHRYYEFHNGIICVGFSDDRTSEKDQKIFQIDRNQFFVYGFQTTYGDLHLGHLSSNGSSLNPHSPQIGTFFTGLKKLNNDL